MANSSRPCGAVPHERLLRARKYEAAGAMYPGDFVALSSAGRVAVAAAGATPLVGAVLSYASGAGESVLVADHPEQLFKINASSTEVDAQTDINLNYDIVATAGNTQYKVSRHKLDSSTGATNSNYPVKLLGIDSRPDDALGTNVDCIIKINNHNLGSGTGTLGV